MIMRAEEECLSYGQIHGYVSELVRYCDAMDCAGITSVLRKAVSGFSEHEVRHDHLWNKQAELDAQPHAPVVASNVKELFPEKSS